MSFNKNFLWGAASASYQIEGAWDADGKGINVWDAHCHETGRIAHGESGDIACDHYHHFREDVALMKKIGINSYRFSLSWARILPEGTGRINEKGIQFYSELIDALLEVGIEPLVTLFHWDYPEALHKRGGWLNPESSEWFREYTKVIMDVFSDRVRYWMTLNEPQTFVDLGYRLGTFAPFEKRGTKELITISHNLLLAHGKAVQTIRQNAKTVPTIGFAFTGGCFTPATEAKEDIEAAYNRSFKMEAYGKGIFLFSNNWWSDPIFFGAYPQEAYDLFGDDMPVYPEDEMKIISEKVDFFGANVYQSMVPNVTIDSYAENCYQGSPKSTMDWAFTPECLYWSTRFFTERYKVPFLITENGMTGIDFMHLDGKVHDPQRIDFIHRYVRELKRATDEGIDVMGYIYWSIMDNFEWASGYDKRFGLIHVDYQTQKRTIKDSGYWYKAVIENNGENL